MINIISKQISFRAGRGPKGVLLNAIKSFERLGYPYCINRSLDATSQLWIQNDLIALRKAAKMKLKAIVGPNLYVFPRQIPTDINMSNFIYVHPSSWVIGNWKYFGFNRCPLESWPVGIDTELFKERQKPEDGIVLVYLKKRSPEELFFLKKTLEYLKIRYEIITYGSYKMEYYVDKLQNTKYIIWLGCAESQGLALEEALSMNVPVLVWDVLRFGHCDLLSQKGYTKDELDYPNVTSAYYFDDRCGIKVKDKECIKKFIAKMEATWYQFNPREYVIESLNLEKQGKELIELFHKYYGISYESGKSELLKSNKKWGRDIGYYLNFIKNKIGIQS